MTDDLIERWHAFAAQSKEAISTQYSDESRALFAEVITQQLGQTSNSNEKFASAEEFAQLVADLRSNEKAWSRHLGDVILKAHDQRDAGDMVGAREMLSSFRASCPWRMFAEITDNMLDQPAF